MLSRSLRTLTLALLLSTALVLAAEPARANARISNSQLTGWGINLKSTSLTVLSDKYLILQEKEVDPKVKAQGKVFRLHVLTHENGANPQYYARIELPAVTVLDNLAVSEDEKTALVIADAGTVLDVVDLEQKTARVLFKHKRGEAGFRAIPQVLWTEGGKFALPGHFYDAEDFTTEEVIASVDPSGSGLSAITKIRDYGIQRQHTSSFVIGQFLNSEHSFWGMLQRNTKQIWLEHWTGPNNRNVIVKGLGFGGLAVGQNKLLYTVRTTPKDVGAFVMDLTTKKKWQLGEKGRLYNYLYMSKDGKTILVSEFNMKSPVISVWYGREADNYKLVPVPGLVKAPLGVIRYAPSGQHLVVYRPSGLELISLP